MKPVREQGAAPTVCVAWTRSQRPPPLVEDLDTLEVGLCELDDMWRTCLASRFCVFMDT